MTTQNQGYRDSSIVGSALLFVIGLAGLWWASGIVIPTVQYYERLHGTDVPPFFGFALRISRPFLDAVFPALIIGGIFFVSTFLRQRFPQFAAFSQSAFYILGILAACLSIYLLGSAGLAFKLTSSDQFRETRFYKRALDDFALLESAEGRFEELNEKFRNIPELKITKVESPAEFNAAETRQQIKLLVETLPKVKDPAAKKRLLATISLFRSHILNSSFAARDIPKHAVEAGVPESKLTSEMLEWIAANLNKDGWEPIPLYKLGR